MIFVGFFVGYFFSVVSFDVHFFIRAGREFKFYQGFHVIIKVILFFFVLVLILRFFHGRSVGRSGLVVVGR